MSATSNPLRYGIYPTRFPDQPEGPPGPYEVATWNATGSPTITPAGLGEQ